MVLIHTPRSTSMLAQVGSIGINVGQDLQATGLQQLFSEDDTRLTGRLTGKPLVKPWRSRLWVHTRALGK